MGNWGLHVTYKEDLTCGVKRLGNATRPLPYAYVDSLITLMHSPLSLSLSFSHKLFSYAVLMCVFFSD